MAYGAFKLLETDADLVVFAPHDFGRPGEARLFKEREELVFLALEMDDYGLEVERRAADGFKAACHGSQPQGPRAFACFGVLRQVAVHRMPGHAFRLLAPLETRLEDVGVHLA